MFRTAVKRHVDLEQTQLFCRILSGHRFQMTVCQLRGAGDADDMRIPAGQAVAVESVLPDFRHVRHIAGVDQIGFERDMCGVRPEPDGSAAGVVGKTQSALADIADGHSRRKTVIFLFRMLPWKAFDDERRGVDGVKPEWNPVEFHRFEIPVNFFQCFHDNAFC